MARRGQTYPRAPRQHPHRAAARLRQRRPERQVARLGIDPFEHRPQREPCAAVRRAGRAGRGFVRGQAASGGPGTPVARQRPDAARPISEARPGQEDRVAGPQAGAGRRHGRRQEAGLHRQHPRRLVERHELAGPAVRVVLRRRGGRRRGRRSRHPDEQTDRACGGARAPGRPDPIFRLIQHGSLPHVNGADQAPPLRGRRRPKTGLGVAVYKGRRLDLMPPGTIMDANAAAVKKKSATAAPRPRMGYSTANSSSGRARTAPAARSCAWPAPCADRAICRSGRDSRTAPTPSRAHRGPRRFPRVSPPPARSDPADLSPRVGGWP